MEETKLAPTADLANEMRKAQAEIVRVAKVSSNIKGPLQRALKVAASITLAGLEILRTRADQTAERTGSEELRKMREQIEKLKTAQESMDVKFYELREEAETAKEEAREESAKREREQRHSSRMHLAKTRHLKGRSLKRRENVSRRQIGLRRRHRGTTVVSPWRWRQFLLLLQRKRKGSGPPPR